MVALTAPRDTRRRQGDMFSRGVAAGVTIYAGALACLNANKFLVPGSTNPNLIADGRAEKTVVGGAADGAVACPVLRGTFPFQNSAGGDALTQADIGNDVFIIDDQTVAKTNPGGNTRSVAGKMVDLDVQGVWVRVGIR